MTLKELDAAFNFMNKPTVEVRLGNDTWVTCSSKVLEEYGHREVSDINIVWERKIVYVWLKATNKEIAEAYFDGFFRD